ncbi:hypothetical protein PSTT_10071 [Puccinia striiformis]|uniref:Uncharacterized protein n=1 Tax=Puccinia striiformis TaxID=27350 RepID=A0A2S4V5X9_9BASI|nr:hypothetical protein PSTT_10071 [Puccinia striiformis]
MKGWLNGLQLHLMQREQVFQHSEACDEICERDDQIGQRQEERVEDKKEPEDLAPQQEVLDNKANEKRNKTHNVQEDLDALD